MTSSASIRNGGPRKVGVYWRWTCGKEVRSLPMKRSNSYPNGSAALREPIRVNEDRDMQMKRVIIWCIAFWTSSALVYAASSAELADALMNGNRSAVRALLQKKADVNAPQVDGTTALHWAVRADDLETADLLIRAGANVNAENRDGVTPMLLAALNGNVTMLDRMIKAGASVNAPVTTSGDTPLMIAARAGKPEAVALLLDKGAQI